MPIEYTGPGGIAILETRVLELGGCMSNDASFYEHIIKLAMKCR